MNKHNQIIVCIKNQYSNIIYIYIYNTFNHIQIRNISINHLWKETYERAKGLRSYIEDHIESQSMALIHFDPDNIFKRMNFRFIDESKDDTEPNVPGDSEAAS